MNDYQRIGNQPGGNAEARALEPTPMVNKKMRAEAKTLRLSPFTYI